MRSNNWYVISNVTVAILMQLWVDLVWAAQPCPTVCPDGSRPYFCVCPVIEEEPEYSRPQPRITVPKRRQTSSGDCNASRRPDGGSDCRPKGSVTPAADTSRLSFEPEMVQITGGTFMMGSPAGEGYDIEHPQHEVTVGDFAMGKYEVTQGEWQAVMGNNPSHFSSCGERCPVENVSWNDVQNYIFKLNAKTGKYYRLPTEAEWEYACRGGAVGETYCGGNDIDSLAWHSGNSDSKTHPVGQKAPNGFGLFDMTGNVCEWNKDRWHGNYDGAPTDGSAWESGDSSGRLLRGCSWYFPPDYCRTAFRYAYTAGPSSRDGFRVVFRVAGRAF